MSTLQKPTTLLAIGVAVLVGMIALFGWSEPVQVRQQQDEIRRQESVCGEFRREAPDGRCVWADDLRKEQR